MSPPAPRHDPAPALRPDLTLDDRYRLHGERAQRPHAVLWRATDEVLARPVAVKVVPVDSPGAPASEDLTEAVARASRVNDPRFARLLDVGTTETADGRVVYIVTEWLEAPSLAAVLRDGPLPAEEASDLVQQVAGALATAAAAGRAHGHLHPGNVFVLPNGEAKVTDLLVGAAVAGAAPDSAADLVALGGLLYAALTATWPGTDASALPPAPRVDGLPREPRLVRPGVPREVSVLTMRLLLGQRRASSAGIDSPARAAQLLAGLPRRRPGTPADEDGSRTQWLVRWRPWLAAALAAGTVAAVGVTGWSVGTSLGRVAGTNRLPVLPSASPGSQAVAHRPIGLVGRVRDFDPQGDGTEAPDAVGLAVDGDPSTSWDTDHYRGSPRFGGLKDGVGLLVDLGTARPVSEVRLALTTPGADVELRVADTTPTAIDNTRVVATASNAGVTASLRPAGAPRARYWVVWLTRVPSLGAGRYGEGVAEVSFLS